VTSTVKNKAGFPIRNLCRSCGEDFVSEEIFGRHKVGVHEYLYAEGIAMEPAREDGRRCLDAEEMEERRWRVGERGQWFDPVRTSRAATAFRRTSGQASSEEGGHE
jgi:hypothetical protein